MATQTGEAATTCTRCALPDAYPGLRFDLDGVCSVCRQHEEFVPFGEDLLVKSFDRARRKRRPYDAVVPLSGGKDSTYILHLAANVYGLNVIAYTLDNGFLTGIARRNIQAALDVTGVDHVLLSPNYELLKKVYRAVLLATGMLCPVCTILIRMTYLKVSEAWGVPLILLGATVMEENSYAPDNINLPAVRAIMAGGDDFGDVDLERALIYPRLNRLTSMLGTVSGRFGRVVCPFYYVATKRETEVEEIIKKEMDWQVPAGSKDAKHFDCLIAPFSEFLRTHRYGYCRKTCHYSNLVRMGQMTRDEALDGLTREDPGREPEATDAILEMLEISRDDLNGILGRRLALGTRTGSGGVIGAAKKVFGGLDANRKRKLRLIARERGFY
jgi:hypothetical protein